jgi:hypothetical protein
MQAEKASFSDFPGNGGAKFHGSISVYQSIRRHISQDFILSQTTNSQVLKSGESRLLGCNAVHTVRQPLTFRTIVAPSPSMLSRPT